MTPATSVEQAIEQLYAALTSMMNGDSGPLGAILSHRDDATAFLGWGGYERGWSQLEPRWAWATSQFVSGQVWAENISMVVTDDLAYTVALEHGLVHLVGRDAPADIVRLFSFGPAIRRSRIPVRCTIHSSLVSSPIPANS